MILFDSRQRVTVGHFDETWARYVVKMATGTGKTKVMALTLVWSYYHKLYEESSTLSMNSLVIVPNIIVLNRVRKDFDGLKMFFDEPFLPENGFEGKDWRNDFQPTLHIQDELKAVSSLGNIFLNNTHRVAFNENPVQTVEETLLGIKPKVDTDTSRNLDLGKILRSEQLKDLMVLNDEAQHIHDADLRWFQNIQEINNKLKLKTGHGIALQADFSATPRHNNGGIFVQTISDYPLVEAIRYNVVKSPVLPDATSREKLHEKTSDKFVERYSEFLHLGYIEWEAQYKELASQKTPILFVMTTTTAEADETAAWLEQNYSLLKGKVLVIHTNNRGEIVDTKKDKKAIDALNQLRKAADDVDKEQSPYRAVVSVLMLREGWDVKNVTTIVGLRPFTAQSKIQPEQTIGRGLRKMFALDVKEKLVVVGTPAFIEFVEQLKTEGVDFEYKPMGTGTGGKGPVIVEVDKENKEKDLEKLDIKIPQMSPKFVREYKNLEELDINTFGNEKINLKVYSPDELKDIIFEDIDCEFSHKTIFTDNVPDYRNVVGYFTKSILKEARLFSGFELLYPKVEAFIKQILFERPVQLEDPQTMRNLSEAMAKHQIFSSFSLAIAKLTISDTGLAEVKSYVSLRNTKPTVVNNQKYIIAKKSVFNKIIGDNDFELEFAAACENRFADVATHAKNTMVEGGVNFKMEYQNLNGRLNEYYPDFFVKTEDGKHYLVETKGQEQTNDMRKLKRMANWCTDVNKSEGVGTWTPIYIKQEDWERNSKDLRSFADVVGIYTLKVDKLPAEDFLEEIVKNNKL